MTNETQPTPEQLAKWREGVVRVFQSLPEMTAEPVNCTLLRMNAIKLYEPPFKFEHGYIYDAKQNMVADDDDVGSHVAAQVRGWGRISYMEDAKALQDEVGVYIAELLTKHWSTASQPPAPRKPITAETPKIYTVFDKDGDPAVSFLSLADCHQHINDSIMNDIPDAARCYIRAMYPEPHQPLQPITAEDVTDEMIDELARRCETYNTVEADREIIEASVNVYNLLKKK